MIRIEYFSEPWSSIQTAMNKFIIEMENHHLQFEILQCSINQELEVSGEICVNGFILYKY